MIISIPAIFIVITNSIFPRLCKRFGAKTLTMIGLLLYTVGGCIAGAFSQIVLVLIMRAFVGIGVGIIMPLSTGLLSFYFPPEKQAKLMGYSSAMNQMGGVMATLLSGVLATISWRLSFLVYLMGFFSIILCVIFVPNDRIHRSEASAVDRDADESAVDRVAEGSASPNDKGVFRQNYVYIIAMFLLMTTFFLYPANFAMETVQDSVIPTRYIASIMAGADLIAFFGGLLFVALKKICGRFARFLAPLLFLAGYLLLILAGGWFGVLAGSACIGFANGVGVPFIIFEASVRAGKAAATTVMPLISAALSGTVSLSYPHVDRAYVVWQCRFTSALLLRCCSCGLFLLFVRADPIREGDPVGAPGLRLRKQQLPVSRERPAEDRCFPPYLFFSAVYFPLSP